MSPDLPDAVRPLLARLAALLDRDPVLRRELVDLARAAAAWLEDVSADEASPQAEDETPLVSPPTKPIEEPSRTSIAELAARLFRPDPTTTPPPARPVVDEQGGTTLTPLGLVASRCRLKAEAARSLAFRSSGQNDYPDDGQIIRRAHNLPDCFIWLLSRETSPRPPRVWEDLAGAFNAAAAAAELLDAWHRTAPAARSPLTSDVLHTVAEVQSTLRSAVADARPGYNDTDQIQLFVHVRETARKEQIFIRRYLRQEDWADPGGWERVLERVDALRVELGSAADRERSRAKTLKNLRYKANRLTDDPADDPDEWKRVTDLIDELVAGGLPPSNAELREILLPIFTRLEDRLELPETVELVLREIDRYLADRPRDTVPSRPEPPTSEVAEVARLLAGREAVLIGGEVRPERKNALIRAFGLADLNWISTQGHTSVTVFEAPIARPEVGLVLLATRWSNHDYQNVKDYCDRYGKPFVKLPAGYHPNQVAYQILCQAGDRLRAAAAMAG
jgi:hypothetical protein